MMKIIATKPHDDGYILEISRSEADLLLRVREALDGAGTDDGRDHPQPDKLNFEGDILIKTLRAFLVSLRSQNDFSEAFFSLKGIISKEKK